jgi:hypothetical protein
MTAPAELVSEADQHVRRGAIDAPAAADEIRGRLDHLAVRVELHLLDGGVADADGAGAGVAGEVRKLPLGRRLPPVEIVEHVRETSAAERQSPTAA